MIHRFCDLFLHNRHLCCLLALYSVSAHATDESDDIEDEIVTFAATDEALIAARNASPASHDLVFLSPIEELFEQATGLGQDAYIDVSLQLASGLPVISHFELANGDLGRAHH